MYPENSQEICHLFADCSSVKFCLSANFPRNQLLFFANLSLKTPQNLAFFPDLLEALLSSVSNSMVCSIRKRFAAGTKRKNEMGFPTSFCRFLSNTDLCARMLSQCFANLLLLSSGRITACLRGSETGKKSYCSGGEKKHKQ